ncbi:MAG: YiiX/YebB-like N1pC/P60 family cysteine hydrolase [Candidatus Paceibacterota bacterium]
MKLNSVLQKAFKKTKDKLKKHRKEIGKNLLYLSSLLLIAMIVIGFKLFYPYEFFVALIFLTLILQRIFKLILLSKNTITQSKAFSLIRKISFKYKKTVFLLLFLILLFYVLLKVLPQDNRPFADMNEEKVAELVDTSLDISALDLDYLEITANTLLEGGLLDKDELTADEVLKLHSDWNEFLRAIKQSEDLTDIHRYFGQISYFSTPEAHTKSFFIAYTLYLKKYEMVQKVIARVDNNERVLKSLNEYSEVYGAKNSFYNIQSLLVNRDTLLRRNLGRLYGIFLLKTIDTSDFGEDFNALVRSGNNSHDYLLKNSKQTVKIYTYKLSSDVESGLFNSWFPIQKNVADVMGKIELSTRNETFITREQIADMKPSLQPGDIFVQRRNWHLSNVGIPGFWPHAALYLGTLEEADKFFAPSFPYQGYETYNDLLKNVYPDFYEDYIMRDTKGDQLAVIEGKAPGIILQSLEESATADYLGVLRAKKLENKDILQAVLRAIGNYGKPYDYNFDFETRDELVCSELVYDAYLPSEGKSGLHFDLTISSGRKIVSPNDMVKKFYEERGIVDQELEFVYFIDGNEELKNATPKYENAFMTSWTRSKFSSLQE